MKKPNLNELFAEARDEAPVVNINEVHSMISETGLANPVSKLPISNLVKIIIMTSTLGFLSVFLILFVNHFSSSGSEPLAEESLITEPFNIQIPKDHQPDVSFESTENVQVADRLGQSMDEPPAKELKSMPQNISQTPKVPAEPNSPKEELLPPPPPSKEMVMAGSSESECEPEFESMDAETMKALNIKYRKGLIYYWSKSKNANVKIIIGDAINDCRLVGEEEDLKVAWRYAPQAVSKPDGSDFAGLGGQPWAALADKQKAGDLFAVAIADEDNTPESQRLLWFRTGTECPGMLCDLEARSENANCLTLTFRDTKKQELVQDAISYPEELVISLDAEKMDRLGFTENDQGIFFNHNHNGATLLMNYGDGSRTVFNAQREQEELSQAEYAPIYASEDLAYAFTSAFSWEGEKRDKNTWFQEKCALVPLKYTHESGRNHYFWYEPTVGFLSHIGMSHFEIQRFKKLLAVNCPKDQIANSQGTDEYEFDELFDNPSYVNGIKMLSLNDETLSKLGIYVEKGEVIHISGISANHYNKEGSVHHFNNRKPEGNIAYTATTVELGPDRKEISVYKVEMIAPQFITDDLAQIWRSIIYPKDIKGDKEEASREDMDSWMREQINSSLLLPVMVRSGSKYTAEDKLQGHMRPDCIFWYTPNEEFLSVLPTELANSIRNEMSKVKDPKVELDGSGGASCNYFEACNNQKGSITESDIYPSPARTTVNVSVKSSVDASGRAILSDIQGHVIETKELKLQKETLQKAQFDVSELSEGIYLMTILSDQGDYITERIIKVSNP